MTSLRDLIIRNRSTRRFDESFRISRETLRELVDLARLSASAANRQPLKYILSWEPEKNARIFPHLAWAGYLTGWGGSAEGERPAAYVLILGDNTISEKIDCDHGIAAQSILLGAVERGLGGCIIASMQRVALAAALGIPDRYTLKLTIALGKPAEQVVIEPLGADGDIRYWRSEDGIHHVPKRALDDLILSL
jgi:nitroreductase